MGWLRELMDAAPEPFRSFDSLADSALKHSGWPSDDRPKVRSLAAIFSKLDRRLELDWLLERPRVQQVLADLLGARLVEIDGRAEARRREADRAAARLRWLDLPDARPLELRAEALCPGLPEEAKNPVLWSPKPLWWVAPDGAGRSLAGQWLSARGSSIHIDARTWQEAARLLPATGSAFVELHEPGAPPTAPLPPLSLCVAAPVEPFDPAFARVTSPAPGAFVEQLVGWVAARLPADGRFQPERAVDWLRRRIDTGLCRTLGDALALCGLLDRLGWHEASPAQLERASPAKLARSLLAKLAEAELERGVHDVAWMLEGSFPLLVGLARRTFGEGDQSLLAPRSFEHWLELIPLEYRRGGDLDWLRLSLSDPNSPVRPSDVDKVARKLPPGAFKVLRGLMALSILRPTAKPQMFVLGPHWLVRTAWAEARRTLLDGSPLEWGEALLAPERAAEIMQELCARTRRDPAPLVEAVLELESADDPAAAAALEAVFRALGLALLDGAELASDQLEALWREQRRLLLGAGPLPLPRIAYPESLVQRCPELGCPAFLLAALAVSEHLPARAARAGVLSPWHETSPPPGLRALYDRVAELFDTPAPAGFVPPALALIDRLRTLLGSVALDGGVPHVLELPGIVLDEVEHGVLTWSSVHALSQGRHALRRLSWLVERRRVDEARLAAALWAAWAAEPDSTPLGLLTPLDDEHRALWRELPLAFTLRAARALSAAGAALPASHLTTQHWTALVEARTTSALDGDSEWLAHAPAAVLERALDDMADAAPLLDDLWRHHADVVARHVRKLCGAEPERAAIRLLSAPMAGESLVPALEALAGVGLPPALEDALRLWLHGAIERRDPAWRSAYALLARIERDRAH